MTKTTAKLLGLFALSAGGLLAAGCGDGPTCPTEIVVVIQSPTDSASISTSDDLDGTAAGIQRNVEVRTNLSTNDEVVLTVTDDRSGAVSLHEGVANSDGEVTFTDVTFPSGSVSLLAEGKSKCGIGSDEVTIDVIGEALCDLSIDEGLISNDFFAPIPVLNASNDSDASLPNFQANLTVQTAPDFTVEFFVLDVASGSEASLGQVTADADGKATSQTTLAQGTQVVRATCIKGSANAASAANTVQVDTIVPTCTLTNPAENVTVTPDHDEDGNSTNGIQMTWTGAVDDAGEGDVFGESSSFFRDASEIAGTLIDSSGNAASETLFGFGSVGDYDVSFLTSDHAGNECLAGFTSKVIMAGCSISIDAPATDLSDPSSIVNSDSDGIDANGLQSDFTVTVDAECVGQTVFVDCGQGESSAVAQSGGVTTIANVTLSTAVIAENSVTCTARVVNPDNFQSTRERIVSFDTLAPGGTLDFTHPSALACGEVVVRNVGNDSTGTLVDGFQIEARVVAPLADTREISVTNATCTTPCVTVAPAGGVVVDIDITDGPNDFRVITRDLVGNQTITGECIVRLEDIAVDIVGPVGTGLLGANSPGSSVNGNGDLETTACATVSQTNVVASLEVISGASTTIETMSFNAGLGQFCTDNPVVLAEGVHQLTVTAIEIGSSRQGSDTIDLTVDLTPLPLPNGFTLNASSPNHRDIAADWSAAAGIDSYVLKFSTTPFTADFANEGTVVPGVGTATSFTIGNLDVSVDYFIGVALADAAGNLSTAETLGPVRPEFNPTGSIVAPDLATASAFPRRFGQSVVSGNFNDDEFDDIAISSPFKTVGANNATGEVYIYFGSANGIGAAPDVTISGAGPFNAFGWAMTRINWSTGAGDGLVVSAPFANQVYIFHGATLSSAAALDTSDANINIQADAVANWFSSGFMGWSLAAGELNSGTSVEDLIIGVPSGNGGVGGAVMIYGGTPSASDFTITLSESADSTDMAGLEAHIFENPVAAANGSSLGYRVSYLGDTRAGDGVGDVAIAYFADKTPAVAEDNAVYLIRGRTPSGSSGISFTALGASDLRVENPTAEASTSYAMQLASIQDQNSDGFRELVITGHEQGQGTLWIVGGSQTGTLVLNDDTDYLTKISGTSDNGSRFAAAAVNGADTTEPDVNGDGLEDLVVSGGTPGSTTGVSVFIWYGGRIPVGDALATSATSIISGPAEFTNNVFGGAPNTLQATWAGDVNNDGLPDLCWADWQAGVATEAEGRFEILWDDPAN